MVVASAGEDLTLEYVRCRLEDRRAQLLAERLSHKATLAGAATEAAEMVAAGSLPDWKGPRARKTEFIRRCSAALALVSPQAEGDPSKLDANQRRMLETALGGESVELWDGREACRNCGSTTYCTDRLYPRCGSCFLPMSYKRSWDDNTLQSMLTRWAQARTREARSWRSAPYSN